MAVKQDSSDQESLKDLIGALAEDVQERRESKQVPTSKAILPTPFNPSGKPRTVRLKCKKWQQNGATVNPDMLTDEEIGLINRLVPGEYAKKKIQILKKRDKSLDMIYKNKSFEDRMNLKNYGRSLKEILEQVLIEQEDVLRRKKNNEYVEDDE